MFAKQGLFSFSARGHFLPRLKEGFSVATHKGAYFDDDGRLPSESLTFAGDYPEAEVLE